MSLAIMFTSLFIHIRIIWLSKDFNYLYLASLSFEWANARKVNAEQGLASKLELTIFINNISFFSVAVIYFGVVHRRHCWPFTSRRRLHKVVLNIKINNYTRFILFLYISEISWHTIRLKPEMFGSSLKGFQCCP